MRTAALLSVLTVSVCAQSSPNACSLDPGVEKEYRALPSMSDLSLSWEERYGPRRELAKRYLTDWPLQFMLQQPILHGISISREFELALAHYRSLPDHLLGELLEARLLSSLQRRKSRVAIDDVLSQAAESPWSHLATLEWAADPRNGDPALAAFEFEEFRQRCPGDILAFQYLRTVRDPQKLRSHVAALRNTIEAAKKRGLDESEVELFRKAWTWEKITYGENRLDEYRHTVRADASYLREHLNYDSWHWVFMASLGYGEILKDTITVRAIDDEVLVRAPNGEATWWIAQERWREQNPPPHRSPPVRNEPIPPSEVAAEEEYGSRQAAFMLPLIERFWGKPYAAFEAGNFLMAQNLPPGMFERLADFVLSNAERFPDQGSSTPPVQVQVAEAYVNQKIRLDRVPALVQQGLEQEESQEKYYRESDEFQHVQAFRNGNDNFSTTRRRAREILIQHAIVTEQKERALTLLSEFRRDLERSKPAGTKGRAASAWRSDQITYSMLARQAGLDVAMADFSVSSPEEPERYPVADFEAKDLSGKMWSIVDLQGKFTFVHIWYSECGSCSVMLGGVQQLYERWKNRTDRVVLTISLNDNPAIAESLMKENKYSFPVIHGADIAEKFVRGGGFLREFLIDPQANRLLKHLPHPSEETIGMIEEMIDEIAAKR
jgi:hypothetical protein